MRNMTDELKKLLDDAVRAVASEKGYEIPEGFLVRRTSRCSSRSRSAKSRATSPRR